MNPLDPGLRLLAGPVDAEGVAAIAPGLLAAAVVGRTRGHAWRARLGSVEP